MTDRILRHLDEDGVSGLESGLDAAGLALQADGIPVDLSGIQHGVAAAPHVDERGLHGGQDVLDAAQIDVADHRGLRAARDVVLDEQSVLKDRDLVEAVLVADDHRALDGLAAGQELGLGNRVAAASLATPLAATHLLRFESCRPLQGLHLIGGIGALLGGRAGGAGAATATATARGVLLVRGVRLAGVGFCLVGTLLGGGRGLVGFLRAAATARLRLRGRLVGFGGGSAVLGRSVVGFLRAAATLGGSLFLGGVRFRIGGGAATLGLRLRFVDDDRRSHFGRSLEDGSLEQQRRGGGHGRV